ncbi:hypothetical protein M8J76_012666 [Diaphorina citri]|nr:hypothetical protein M8J76_012666 [Diaphorina citri]
MTKLEQALPRKSPGWEGDITQKGYEKKRTRLLAPYAPKQTSQVSHHGHSPNTRARRSGNRRLTRHESRYHSEVRQEAVQQALAAMQNRPKPSLPMPSKRTSVLDREPHDSGKLLSRSLKVAYTLLTKPINRTSESSLKSGDRIALVYPNNDPINFLCAFYGCIFAGIVPVPIEVPLTRRSFQWMSRVLQAVDSIHQVGLYCLALVPPNYLPKTPLGGIHLSECKRRFLEGNLHPANVLLCPHTCVTNLPKPREIHSGVMELCTKGLSGSIPQLKARNIALGCVRTCVVVAEERPRIHLTSAFSKLFSALGLSPRAVSTSFGCRVNIAICLQIWVQSPHNASGYFSLYGDESEYAQQFSARLVTGNTGELYARTGYLGFLRRTSPAGVAGAPVPPGVSSVDTLCSTGGMTDIVSVASLDVPPSATPLDAPELHDAVFVVGALDETIMLRGMRYHPIDIENSVMRAHKKIAECAVFTWTNLLVVVVELDGNESEALDLVPLVTNAVLEEHHLIVGVAVVVDPGVVPINSRGEKQRMHLRDGFLADQLDPIYVAYNM